jgi:hypothetical protein
MIESARKSGHRVFVIGVGSSPAESVLRTLAEATGGTCEFATPGEALEAASARMLARMRQPLWRDVRVEWRGNPAWQTPLPLCVFGGDTVVAFAGMQEQGLPPSARLWAKDSSGREVELASGEAETFSKADTLPRMAAARRLAMVERGEAKALAVSYQLMSGYTNCILVHERAEADKAIGEAELHQVSSMLAAGWGASSDAMLSMAHDVIPCVIRSVGGEVPSATFYAPVGHARELASGYPATPPGLSALPDDDDSQTPVHAPLTPAGPASLADIARAVVTYLVQYRQLQGLSERCQSLTLHPDARKALDKAIALGLTEEQALLLLAHWTNERTGGLASSFYTSVLQPHVDGLEPTWIGQSTRVFERLLGGYANSGWELSRAKRLRRLLTAI